MAMETLCTALEMTPWRLLMIIARQRGLRISSNTHKTDLVARLLEALSDPTNLQTTLTGLAEPERRALEEVLAAGGRLPLRYLRSRHGGFRSVRELYQWRYDAPLSPLEQLRISGLIFYDAESDDVFVPVDLAPLLPAPDVPPPPAPQFLPGPAPADLTCHDLAVLLALLQRDDVRPLAGGWLPPRFLATWGQHCAVSPSTQDARSEKQTGRRRFLHYLATQAGFIAPSGPFLKPTPAAWLWLKAARAERFHTLWSAWSAPDVDLWHTFALPGADWLNSPAILINAIHNGLNEMETSDPESFAQALVSHCPQLYDLLPPAAFDREALLVQTIAQLIASPLVWLGVLQGEHDLRLTPQAAAWLAGASTSEDVTHPFARFSITSDLQPNPLESTLTLTLSQGLPDPAHVAVVIEVGNREETATSYSVSCTSFVQALHHGWSAPALLDALDHLAERPLTGQERALLWSWAERAERVTIRRLLILETSDPGVVNRLTSARRGRSLIVRTLSPRAVVVDESRLDQLVHRLTRQEDIPPRVEMPLSDKSRAKSDLGPSGAAHVWLALRVYQGLGQLVRLAVRTPQSLLEYLETLADPSELAAAQTAAQATLDALQETLIGGVPFPPWSGGGLPVEESLAVIEKALAAGHDVEIDYYTAGRDVLTHRVVEPYRLEWRNNVPYLVGFCQRVQAERVFRLDRIHAIAELPQETEDRE